MPDQATLWALIVDGRVYQLEAVDPTDRFNSAMRWVTAPNGTFVGDAYSGGVFTHPAAPPPAVPQTVSKVQAVLALHAVPGSGSATLLGVPDLFDINSPTQVTAFASGYAYGISATIANSAPSVACLYSDGTTLTMNVNGTDGGSHAVGGEFFNGTLYFKAGSGVRWGGFMFFQSSDASVLAGMRPTLIGRLKTLTGIS